MNYYQAARMLTMPGVSVNPTIDPSVISIRTRNSAKRMLMDGYIKGGHRSQAARLAQALAEEFNVPCVREGCMVSILGHACKPDTVNALCSLIDADFAVFRLEKSGNGSWISRNMHVYKARAEATKQNLRRGEAQPISYHSRVYRSMAVKVVRDARTASDARHASKIAEKLYTGEIIPITKINSLHNN